MVCTHDKSEEFSMRFCTRRIMGKEKHDLGFFLWLRLVINLLLLFYPSASPLFPLMAKSQYVVSTFFILPTLVHTHRFFTTSILLHRHRAAVTFLTVARLHSRKPNLLTPHVTIAGLQRPINEQYDYRPIKYRRAATTQHPTLTCPPPTRRPPRAAQASL